jgi:phosphate starvation-inducible PhoH-like protein
LSEICGVNDINLKSIESLAGAEINSRGNELFIEGENPESIDLITSIIDELKNIAKQGKSPNPEIVKEIYHSITKEEGKNLSLFRDTYISIPNGYSRVYPRSIQQAKYMEGMREYDMSFCTGPAGTGKTFLAVAHALEEVLSRKRRKLVLTRPVVEAGENLGFLPGDLAQKINPYLRPLYDAMESLIPNDIINRMEDSRYIEIAPLAYMRGRSLKDCFIILDEAQNTTREQMKMFLTRLGEGSKAVITGDVTQIDLPSKKGSGLLHAVSILGKIEDIFINRFSARDVVRNPLVKKIINAYESENK